jgi:cysteine synthase A
MPSRSPIANNILELIGRTPMVRLNRLVSSGSAEVVLKLESFNPMASVKDRIGAAMLEAAEQAGAIRPGETVIIEPTSGNTGVALAFACAVKGYSCVIVMPDTMTIERRRTLRAFGARVVLTPGAEGMKGAIAKAEEILRETPNGFMPQQFTNPANPDVHRRTTALEIFEDADGRLDALVAGVGTGGTVTGCAEVLKAKLPNLLVCAVEPQDSPVLSGGAAGPHKIQGIGAGFKPEVLNLESVDRVIPAPYAQSLDIARRLTREEGIFLGISSGAICWAALQIAQELGPGKRVVAVMPSFGERYLSHEVYASDEE